MSERGTFTYGAATGSARPGARAWLLAALVALALLSALAWFLAGRTQAPPPRASHPPAPAPTRRNAVESAVSALYQLSIPAVTDRRRFDRAIRDLAAPGATGRIRATFGATDPATLAAFAERPHVLRSAPLGYRIEAYDGRSASVAIWTVAIAGTRRYGISVEWRTLTIELAWTGRQWKVVGGAGRNGPVPTGSVTRLATSASTFEPLRHVP